jgi:tetratricopeptide (TPR) repeat protein
VKSLFKSVPFVAAIWVFGLAGCSPIPVQATDTSKADATGPHVVTSPPEPETQVVQLRPGELPYVSLTGDIFYRVMAAELAAQRGMYGFSASTLMQLAQDTGDSRLARRALEFQLASGNMRGALAAARLWAEQAPADIEATSTELALSAANGETEGLSTALRNRIDASEDKPEAIGQALSVLSRLQDRRLALKILEQSLSANVRQLPDAHMALADVAYAAGDDARAIEESRAALKADPHSELAAQRILEYGARLDREQAESEARAFLAQHPDASNLRLSLIGLMSDSGNYDAALSELRSLSRREPENFDLLHLQAQMAYKAGYRDQSRQLLEQYLDVQSQRQKSIDLGATDALAAEADARVLLSRIAEDQGNFDEAIAQLAQISDASLRYSAKMRQAALRAKQGRIDDALKMIDAAQPNDEEDEVQGILAKSQILRDANRLPDAVRVLNAANRSHPDTIEIKYELAMLYDRQSRYPELETLLRQVIDLDPEHAHALNALGYSLADRNQRLPEALDLITQALELLPDNPFILDSLGWVKFKMGENEAAAEALSRAYALLPEAEIAAHLADVRWAQGKRQQAEQLLNEGYSHDPKNRTLLETAKRLGIKLKGIQ